MGQSFLQSNTKTPQMGEEKDPDLLTVLQSPAGSDTCEEQKENQKLSKCPKSSWFGFNT